VNDLPTTHARNGLLFGLTAYVLWGLVPLYFKALHEVAPLDVLAQRIVWSLVVLVGILSASCGWSELRLCLRSKRAMRALIASASLIALNWLVFIYSVASGQVLQASLGYFITPLINVVLGLVFLGERLRTAQWVAVALAAIGVIELTVVLGEVPWIALTLSVTFGCYGLLRKTVAANGIVGLTVESIVLFPAAGGWVVYGILMGRGPLGNFDRTTDLLLLLSGLVTTVPLLFFIEAARRLRLSTIGFLQYLSPSIAFLLAVAVFHEPFSTTQLVSFVIIWTALVIVSIDSVVAYRQKLAQLSGEEALVSAPAVSES